MTELLDSLPAERAAGEGPAAIVAISLDGVPVDLGGVLADVTIRHGRTGYFDSASPSTAQLALLGVTRAFTRPFKLGALLVVTMSFPPASTAARFTGRLTDATLDGDALTVIAVARSRTLSGYTVGAVDWPAERWSERVTRAFREAGLALTDHLANGGFDSGLEGWYIYPSAAAGVLALDATTGSPAAPSAKLTVAAAVPGSGAGISQPELLSATTPCLPLPPGDVWTWEYRIRAAAGLTPPNVPFFYLDFYGSADAHDWIDGFQHDPAPSGSWQTYKGTVSRPAGANFYDVGVYFRGDSAPGGILNVDGFRLYSGEDVLELQVGTFDPVLVARPAEPVQLARYLDELAEMLNAAVFDRGGGKIVVQAPEARSFSGPFGIYSLVPGEVAYAPVWEMRLPRTNICTVTYGEPEASVTVRDDASVAIYGPLPETLKTAFRDSVDAASRASNRVGRNAYGRWTIDALALLVGRRLLVGQTIEVKSLPAAAPFDPWSPVLEGWTETIVSDGEQLDWTMELALSDPLLSGLTLPWNAVPPAELWNTVPIETAWNEALTPGDL